MERVVKLNDLVFLGDIMPGGELHYKKDFASDDIKSYLSDFKYRIATLETAIGDDFPFDYEKMNRRMNIIYSKNSDISKVVELNINVVSLANNHVFDLGVDGFKNTVAILEKHNIVHCGAGLSIDEASKPAIINSNGHLIAIFAYCMYGTKHIGHVPLATKYHHGINPLDIDRAINDIRKAKEKYDSVIIMPHWGREYTYFPLPQCKTIAYKLIDAGADAVIGGHTHQIQPLIKYKGKPIYFSLSNFLFPDYYMQPPRPMWYPDEEYNRQELKRYYHYPSKIDTHAKLIWRENSRISIMAEIDTSNINITSYRLSYLNSANTVVFFNKKNSVKIRRKLLIIGIVVKFKFYKQALRLHYSHFNICRKGFYLFKKFMAKKKA